MILSATTHTLELVTSAAVATDYDFSFSDIDKSGTTAVTPGSAQGQITTATTTTAVSAPGASVYRVISSASVRNVGGAVQTVTVQRDVSGANRVVFRATLAANEGLHYEDGRGWYVMTADGEVSSVGAPGADGTDGGGTVLGSGTSILDFGSAGSSHASLVVTGQAAILAGSLVYVWLKPEDTADHSADEHMVETIKVFAASIVAGVGFTIHGLNTSQRFEPAIPNEALRARYSGTGQDAGLGQAARNASIYRGGRGTRIRGQWSVGWMYTQ